MVEFPDISSTRVTIRLTEDHTPCELAREISQLYPTDSGNYVVGENIAVDLGDNDAFDQRFVQFDYEGEYTPMRIILTMMYLKEHS